MSKQRIGGSGGVVAPAAKISGTDAPRITGTGGFSNPPSVDLKALEDLARKLKPPGIGGRPPKKKITALRAKIRRLKDDGYDDRQICKLLDLEPGIHCPWPNYTYTKKLLDDPSTVHKYIYSASKK